MARADAQRILLVAFAWLTSSTIATTTVVVSKPVSAQDQTWIQPVEADVADPFRPPEGNYSAGNRGIEYATTGGETVVAVAAGTVGFVGVVGNQRFVVVNHDAGLRSTYAYVEQALVTRGQQVEAGDEVAVAGPGFHLTARLGDIYIDPMLLVSGVRPTPRLTESALPTRPPPEDLGHTSVIKAIGAAGVDLIDQYGALADAVRAWRHEECTPNDAPPPSNAADGHLLIQVAGLGSSSGHGSIGALDSAALGYDPDDIASFSYAGGCNPAPFGADGPAAPNALSASLPQTTYDGDTTHQPLQVSAARLADLIEAVAVDNPGQPIDVAAHSLGGVVTRLAVDLLVERGVIDPTSGEPLGTVITIGSPHQGTDLATGAVAAHGTPGEIINLLTDHAEATSILQLAEGGGLDIPPLREPPPGVETLAIAGSTDLIVTAEHAIWPGATNVLIPTGAVQAPVAHGRLPGLSGVTEAVGDALAGQPPRCVDLLEVIGSAIAGRAISSAEDLIALGVGLAGFVF